MPVAETYVFAGDGRFPNSPLPLMIYRRALVPSANLMERHFGANGWSNAWRDGIYRFHHFHSIAHEVLGVAAGQVHVGFGGPGGSIVMVAAGDVVIIPAGVAHCNQRQSADLLVIGAYPEGSDYNIKRGDPHEYAECREMIAAVKLPERNPVTGGPLEAWLG